MSAKAGLQGRLLALILFPGLTALAVSMLFGRFNSAGMDLKLRAYCQPSSTLPTTYLIQYTGLSAFDKALCPLVTFFHNIMDSPTSLSFLTYAIGIGAPLILLPLLEACRIGRHGLVAYPVIWGLFMQTATFAVIFPIYWLVFILAEGSQKDRNFSIRSFTQAEAEAMVFGVIIGAVIPSVAMLTMTDPYLTAIWQIYPAIVSIAQLAHLQFRPVSRHPQSGYRTMQVLYIASFIVSSSVHISTVWPIFNDFAAIKTLLLPSLSPLHPSEELNLHLLNFLKWDVIIAYSATALAMLWFTKNIKQVLTVLLWYSTAIPVLGFGAAVMGVAIWRDGVLD